MYRFKRFFVLGNMLLAVSMLFAFTPLVSTAFAATMVAHKTATSEAATTIGKSVSPAVQNPNNCPPSQSENNPNNNTSWVEVLQFSLNSLFAQHKFSNTQPARWTAPLQIDGDFEAQTRAAVVDFQFKVGLGSSGGGVAGDRTWAYLGFCFTSDNLFFTGPSGSTSFTNCPPTQSENNGGDSAVLVEAIQDHLNYYWGFGFFPNKKPADFQPWLNSDGSFGPLTRDAVVDFQMQYGLGSSGGGVVGQRTWSLLNMCF
jgi:peptidoglycan hydrolase-like protein with peptidoglycan-binding domain